jgi:hypothetical protein
VPHNLNCLDGGASAETVMTTEKEGAQQPVAAALLLFDYAINYKLLIS